MTEFLTAFLNTLDHLPIGWLAAAVFFFMTLETSLLIGLLMPGDIVVLAAGAATSNPQETVLVCVFATLGTLAGQSGGYFIGRMIGPRIRSRFLRRWITDENWARAEVLLKRGAGAGILAAQFLPVVHATLPVVAGITKLEFRRFAFWAGIGSSLWAIIYVGAGAIFGQLVRTNPSHIGRITLMAAVLIGGLWLLGYLVDRVVLKPKRQAKRSKKT